MLTKQDTVPELYIVFVGMDEQHIEGADAFDSAHLTLASATTAADAALAPNVDPEIDPWDWGQVMSTKTGKVLYEV